MEQTEKKYRNELKFQINAQELIIIEDKIKRVMDLDPYVDREKGYYIIGSLYFDNYQNDAYHDNEFSLGVRKKYRIRMYNRDNSYVILEKKEKHHNKSHKKSCPLTKEEYMAMFYGNVTPLYWQNSHSLIREFVLDAARYLYHPTVIVHYERTPYIYFPGNVRVTLDKNISSSGEIDRFYDGSYTTIPIQETGKHLLEVKYDEFLPEEIKQVVQLESLEQSTFSKYYLAREMSRKYGGI